MDLLLLTIATIKEDISDPFSILEPLGHFVHVLLSQLIISLPRGLSSLRFELLVHGCWQR